MDTSELYTLMVKRERRLWIALGGAGVAGFLIICLFFFMYLSVAKEKSKLIAYTPTGIPKYVEYKSGGRDIIEIQSFTKEMLTRAFSLKYSDFLNSKPAEVLAPLKPFFVPEYYNQFCEGLVVSKYIEKLIELRAVTVVSVQDPVEVRKNEEGYWAKATITKQDLTATNDRIQTIAYAVLIKPGDRVLRNPWGLYADKIYTVK